MANSEKGLLFFYDWRVPFQELSGDECKALLLAMLDYSQNDIEPPAFEGSAKIAASFLFPALMRSKQCAKAGRTGGLSTASGGASGTASSTASGAASSTASGEIQAQDKTKTRQNKTRQDETETKQDETETKQDNLTEQRFSAFWEAYPKKQAREDAKKAFLEIAPDESTLDAILAAIERQKGRKEWQKNGGQFIPLPASWLNAKRWEDVEEIPCLSDCQFKPSTGFATSFDDLF